MRDYESLMVGPVPPVSFTGNGVGVAGTHRLVRLALWSIPDAAYVAIEEHAARFHDWAYAVGGSDDDRAFADSNLRTNVDTILRRECGWAWKLVFLRPVGWLIYRAVRDAGWLAWNAGGKPPDASGAPT